jgi:serine/threonine protein kinase
MSTTSSPKPTTEIGVTLQTDESLSETLRFDVQYTVTQRLRSGSYGTVFVTRHIGSDEDYAVKVIDRTYVSSILSV